MMNKKILKWIKMCLINILLCQVNVYAHSDSGKPLNIVTSFYPMYAITKEIVGDKHNVLMINSGNGIHGFEPSANDMAAIYNSDIFIFHSVSLESWTKNIPTNAKGKNVKLIEASKGLDLLKVHGLEDMEVVEGMNQASLYDPHTWLDPLEAGREAQLIAEELSELDPLNAEYYKQNAEEFNLEATSIVKKYQPIFSELKQKTFVTQHTAFSYLAQRFGLTQLGIAGVSSDVEPTTRQLAEIQKFVAQYKVKTIFLNQIQIKILQKLLQKQLVQIL